MLIDRYLPAYHFKEYHSVPIHGFFDGVYQQMLQCNFSSSSLIRILFKLRGMPKEVCSIEHLTSMGFIKLDEEPGREILFGMVTSNPMFNNCQPNLSSKEFIQKADTSIIKAVINFRLQDISNSQHIISTETRVRCGSKLMKSKFRCYWLFIKPFSQLIRRAMLQQMKKQVLASAKKPLQEKWQSIH